MERLSADGRGARGRGRPQVTAEDITLRELHQGVVGMVYEVYRRARLKGNARGALTDATHAVAEAHNIEYGTLKRAVSRYRWVQQVEDESARSIASLSKPGLWAQRYFDEMKMASDEFDRRTLGMPEDVRRALGPLPFHRVLQMLREAGIDGTCPQWLVDWARTGKI